MSRSQEAKDIGIPMGIPLFQIKDTVQKHNIAVYSSNYTLYGDMSSRVHDAISHFSNEVENYSIDEAFVTLEANQYSNSFHNTGIEIKTAVKKWSGIPTSIGIAPTKTLAKIAGDIAKKNPHGVFDLTDAALRERVLEKTDIIDIWGINTRTAKKLHALGIYTAQQLRDLDLKAARKSLTVVGARIVQELQGVPCLSLELVKPKKQSICCSRSFAGEVKTFGEMAEALINFVSTAAEKMRKQNLVTNAVSVFIETNRFKEKDVYANSATMKVNPTDSTRELISYGLRLMRSIYRPAYGYRKVGVILLGLQPVDGETRRLFNDNLYLRDRDLMNTLDAINEKYGRQTVRFGLSAKRYVNWKMNRNFLSPNFTTAMDQILQVR